MDREQRDRLHRQLVASFREDLYGEEDPELVAARAAQAPRLRRQRRLLRVLRSGTEAEQLAALHELGHLGDADARTAVYGFVLGSRPELAQAARIAFRQIDERALLGTALTTDEAPSPALAAGAAAGEPAEPPEPPPAVGAVDPPAGPELSAAPEPASAPAAPEPSSAAPEPPAGLAASAAREPAAAPAHLPADTTLQDAALLPHSEDYGLLPQ